MKQRSIVRLLILLLILISLILIGRYSGIRSWFEFDQLVNYLRGTGLLGIFIFTVLFCLGLLLYMPGIVFIFIATVIYGPIEGAIISYISALIAVTFNFYFVRLIGGKPLGTVRNSLMRRILSNIDKKPIQAMFVLRILFWLSPVLNSVLALSDIKKSHFHLGNVVGLIVPVIGFTVAFYFFEQAMSSFFL